MRASSPIRQLAALGAIALVGFLVLAVHAGTASAGSRAAQLRRFAPSAAARPDSLAPLAAALRDARVVRADTDTVIVRRPAPADSAAADTSVLRAGPVPGGPISGGTVPGDAVVADTSVARRIVADTTALGVRAVTVPGPDDLLLASADTVRTDTTRRALEYLPGVPTDGTAVSAVDRRVPGLRGTRGTYWQRQTTLDSTAYTYTVRESVGGEDVRVPAILTLDEFIAAQRRATLRTGLRALTSQRADRGRRRDGVGITVDIPGGEQSAFRTLFGKNEVDLTVSGRSNVDLGVAYNQSELQDALATNPGGSLAPDFAQQLNLSVAGTIGDKLRINVNYDTESQFQFENQVSLVYTGYQDDIVQRIEAGNVLLQTPSELIQGGQRLFGVRTDLRFGPLALTAVASQQDAESSEVVIEGGSQSTPFSIQPTEYEDNTHFFLGYAFHNTWDGAHVQPALRTLPPGFREIVNIEVFRHEPGLAQNPTTTDEIITATALADLAEPGGTLVLGQPRGPGLNVLRGGEQYLADVRAAGLDPFRDVILPAPGADVYSDADLVRIRANEGLNLDATFGLPVGGGGSASGLFRRLRRDIDFTIDAQLGTVSLTAGLQEGDYLAVAYQYRLDTGAIVTVGDYGLATSDAQQRTVLKLLRNPNPVPESPTWDLTMRNIYRIGGRSLNPSAFTLGLTYEASGGTPQTEFPDVSIRNTRSLTLLQVLGLDRHNVQNQPTPDEIFDFDNGLTVNAETGRIIFPVRQPFGDYLESVLRTSRTVSGTAVDVGFTAPTTREDAIARYVFPQLYNLQASTVRTQFPVLSRYRIRGEFRSAAQSVFNVGFNLVPGTVRVTSGGQPLVENTDFRVNIAAGTVEIINPALLQSGRQVRVQVEQNQIFAIGAKTLLGLRADYRLAENTVFGGTLMRLSERPLVDKFNIGTEAIDNSILGLDGRYIAEPRWITRALDALPLLQTRAVSRVELRGEFARLTPSHPQTLAFDQTVRRLRETDGVALPEDEIGGVSYVDDFEGSENAYSQLGEAGGWRLAAVPTGAGPAGSVTPGGEVTMTSQIGNPDYNTNWRGLFAWYSIVDRSYADYIDAGRITRATRPIRPRDLFPERYRNARGGSNDEANRPLGLLDLYFDPARRGPYNYNSDLAGRFAGNPRDVWGGMVRPLPGNYADFNGQNNVEFVEMIVTAVGGRSGDEDIQTGAVMYLDLGQFNEDVVPDRVLSREDGLRDPATLITSELTPYGRRATGNFSGSVDVYDSGRTEDLGLDGLPSTAQDVTVNGTPYPAELAETSFFASFLASNLPESERGRAGNDPSGDDFHHFLDDTYFNNPSFFPGGSSVQERYAQYLPSTELNSVQAQAAIARSGQDGISTQPNTEDIDGDISIDFSESFHRYAIPLDRAGLAASPFFQNTISVTTGPSAGETYYLLRIPVRTENRTEVGIGRDDFGRISAARLWTGGHDRPATIRIASFQLVGSPWLQSTRVGQADDVGGIPPGTPPRLFVATVNSDESPDTYARPRQAIYRETALPSAAGSGSAAAREQALVLRAEDLADGRTAGLQRAYTTRPLDLTRYSNLRMYVHGHGFEQSDSMRVVIRIGDDETENYYEYEQPIYPFELDEAARLSGNDDARADSLWQTATQNRPDRNSVNIVLSELNKLKVARDAANVLPAQIYRSAAPPQGAPRGARLAIRGQPSIQDVRSVVLGVRNGVGGRVTPIDTVEVWYNELRVSGYDETPGASGFLVANVTFADVGAVQARFSQTQDGFGGLSGGLGERELSARTAVSIASSFNAHRLLPARFGWSIPVTYAVTANESTPRYDPRRGDTRLDDLVAQTLADTSATAPDAAQRRIDAASIVERAQTVSGTRNFRIQASKTGSRSPWLRYSLDGLSAAYSSSAQTARDPSNAFNDVDSWVGNLNYRVAFPRPKTVRPLWFAGGVPLVRALSGLRVNIFPQAISFVADANRSTSQVRARLATLALTGETPDVTDFRTRTRRTQLFTHRRQTDLQYNPFPFLQLSYGSNTDQDFGVAGQNRSFRILARNRRTGSFQTFDISPDSARVPGSVVYEFFNIETAQQYADSLEVLGGESLDILPVGEALGNVFSGGRNVFGERNVRTRTYSQSLTASLRVSTARLRWLSWVRPQALSYQTAYQWQDTPISGRPELDVAGAGARVSLQTGLQLVPTDFWRLFPFYRRLETSAGRGPGGGRGRPAQAPADTSAGRRRGFNPAVIGRNLFLAATGLTDVTVTYRGAFSSSSGGLVGNSYSLLSGLTGAAPGLGYRLGLDRSLPLDRRFTDPLINVPYSDALENRHAFDARTTVEPFRQLRIGLTWQTSFGETTRLPFTYTAGSLPTPLPADRAGSGESTIYAFGGSYASLLDRHRNRFVSDTQGAQPGTPVESEFLLRTGLASDFQSEFVKGFGTFGPRGLFAIPVPGWDISYSGLGSLPLVRRIAQQITLRHNYSATSRSDYQQFFTDGLQPRAIPVAGDGGTRTLNLVAEPVDPQIGSSEANVITVNERYQPFLGASIGLRGGIQTDITWNRSNLYTLQATSAQLTEKNIEELQVQFSYAKTGLRLLGLRRLNNNLRLSLAASYGTDQTLQHNLRTDLLSLLINQPLTDQRIVQRRLQLSPRISYTISNQVTADVFLRFERSNPQGGPNAYATKKVDGGVSLRILFSN